MVWTNPLSIGLWGGMCTTFLVGLRGIPMECPMCLQGTRDVLSGQGMLKANLDMSESTTRGKFLYE